MFNIINTMPLAGMFPIQSAWSVGIALTFLFTLVGFLMLMVLHGHEPSEMIEATFKQIALLVIVIGLFSTSIFPNKVTPIQAFVEGMDGVTTAIAIYFGGDPSQIAKSIFDDYAKRVQDSSAFASSINSSQVGWWTKLTANVIDPMTAFTLAIIHVCELIILAVYAGAMSFVLIIRKIMLGIALTLGFLIIPFILIPSLKGWVKNWILLVFETAGLIILVAILMSVEGQIIQYIFQKADFNEPFVIIDFLAVLAAGLAMMVGAASLAHQFVQGSVAYASAGIASAKAGAAGRGTTMGITHGARNLEKGGALRGGYSGIKQGISDAKEIQKYQSTGGAQGKAPGDIKRAMAQQNLMTRFGHSVGSTGTMMKDKTSSVIQKVPTIIRPMKTK